jgi:hypothetical protein
VLLEGHSKGWWEYRPETTNTEHLLHLQGPRERLEALHHLTESYERAWYGLREPSREEFLNCRGWRQRMEVS